MIRVRIGVRLSNPFGLFNNAGTFVVRVNSENDFAALFVKVNGLKEVLYGLKNDKATELADRLFVEKG